MITIEPLPASYAEHTARDAIKPGLPHSNNGGHKCGFAADAVQKKNV